MMHALDIHRMLLEHGTRHEIVRLDTPAASADRLPEILNLPRKWCLAVRMYVAEGKLLATIVRAGEHPALAAVRAATGVRHATNASPELVNATTDYAARLVAPLLLPDGVELLIDRRILEDAGGFDVVYTPTGEGGTALGIRLSDLMAVSGARPVDLATRPEVPRQAPRPPAPGKAGRTSVDPSRRR